MIDAFDKNLLPEFESVKDNDEEIIWTGKPKFIPFVLSEFLIVNASLIISLIIFYEFHRDNPQDTGSKVFIYLAFIPVLQVLYKFANRLFSYKNTFYAYSNKRVLMRTGFIGTDFKTIDYDKISDTEVTINIIERIFNVGSIKFFSGRTQSDEGKTEKLYDKWEAIENPYEIFKRVKQISVDVKTDFSYPNALRPEVNPGYKTKYERQD